MSWHSTCFQANMARSIVLGFLWIGCSYAASLPLFTFPAALNADIKAAVVDSAGSIYVTGVATKGLPVTSGVLQPALNLGGQCIQPDSTDCTDAFVAKFSRAGELIYATYLGGSDDDGGTAIAVDNAGNAYVTGYTYSHNFPLTATAYLLGPAFGNRSVQLGAWSPKVKRRYE